MPNGQGILVAGTNVVFWLGLDGHVVRTYAIPGALSFALNISPDGRSFWTATAPEAIDNAGHTPATGVVFKVDICVGANPGNGRVYEHPLRAADPSGELHRPRDGRRAARSEQGARPR